jgi:chromosome segregation ATPase
MPKGEFDDEGGVATDKLAEKLDSDIKESRAKERDDDVVEIDPTEEVDIDAKSEEDRETRREKKQERKRLRDEAERTREENRALKQRLEQVERSSLDIARDLYSKVGPARDKPDPIEDEVKTVRDAEEALLTEYNALQKAGGLAPEQLAAYRKRAQDIEDRKQDALTKRSLARQGYTGAVHPDQIARQIRAQSVQAQYSDVYADQRHVLYADGAYQQLRAEGHPDSPETLDLAMKSARQKFKLGKSYARSDDDLETDRRRFAGSSRGAAAGGSSNGNGKVVVKKGSAEWQMAQAFSSHLKNLTDEQKVQRWYQKVGSAKR